MSNDFSSAFPAFAFDGVAQHRRGWRAPISIRVEPPVSDRPREYVCAVRCSLIERLKPVRSSTPGHAYALTFRLLRFLLADFSLFEGSGDRFHLPRIAPEEDDWAVADPGPEHGLRVHAEAVGPDGDVRPFAMSVSVPKAVDDEYLVEVRYERKEPPAKTIRGKTATEAYYAGIDWIEDRFNRDRVTLLGLWNEPIELPKRPKT